MFSSQFDKVKFIPGFFASTRPVLQNGWKHPWQAVGGERVPGIQGKGKHNASFPLRRDQGIIDSEFNLIS